jgi:hypothetical protein
MAPKKKLTENTLLPKAARSVPAPLVGYDIHTSQRSAYRDLRPFPPIARRKTGVLPDALLRGKDRMGGRAMPARLASLAREALRRNATNAE